MPRLVRHPYCLRELFYTEDGIYAILLHQPLEEGFGMTSDLMAFLKEHAKCKYCGKSTRRLGQHFVCSTTIANGRRQSMPPTIFIPRSYTDAFCRLYSRDNTKRWSFQRKRRLQDAGGSYTRDEILTLRELQEDRCFYCLASLIGPGGGMNGPAEPVTCHADHFVPLVDGGTNAISNIVLACPRCNDTKNQSDGMEFLLNCMKQASREDRVGLKRIHSRRKKHPYKLVPPATRDKWALPDFGGM